MIRRFHDIPKRVEAPPPPPPFLPLPPPRTPNAQSSNGSSAWRSNAMMMTPVLYDSSCIKIIVCETHPGKKKSKPDEKSRRYRSVMSTAVFYRLLAIAITTTAPFPSHSPAPPPPHPCIRSTGWQEGIVSQHTLLKRHISPPTHSTPSKAATHKKVLQQSHVPRQQNGSFLYEVLLFFGGHTQKSS